MKFDKRVTIKQKIGILIRWASDDSAEEDTEGALALLETPGS